MEEEAKQLESETRAGAETEVQRAKVEAEAKKSKVEEMGETFYSCKDIDLRANSYVFSMCDAVQNVTEYFVDFPVLEEMARKHGLRITKWSHFIDVYQAQDAKTKGRLKMSLRELATCTLNGLYKALELIRE